MTSERVTERADGARVVERDSGGDRGGMGVGGIIIGLAVLALVAVVAFFLLNQSQNDDLRTHAVTGAAATVADSASSAAKNVGDAAQNVGDSAQTMGETAKNAEQTAPAAPSR